MDKSCNHGAKKGKHEGGRGISSRACRLPTSLMQAPNKPKINTEKKRQTEVANRVCHPSPLRVDCAEKRAGLVRMSSMTGSERGATPDGWTSMRLPPTSLPCIAESAAFADDHCWYMTNPYPLRSRRACVRWSAGGLWPDAIAHAVCSEVAVDMCVPWCGRIARGGRM
jgi:hypothetical protein